MTTVDIKSNTFNGPQNVAGGGTVTEEVFTNCGHSPHLERPEQFRELLARFVNANP